MNVEMINGRIYYLEGFVKKRSKDYNGNKYPSRLKRQRWGGRDNFLYKLKVVESYLFYNKKYKKVKTKSCTICEKNNTTKIYILDNITWEDGYRHYIKHHGVKPSDQFIKKITNYSPIKIDNTKHTLKMGTTTYSIGNLEYVKLKRNQIMIIDALMIHGGYAQKYYDKNEDTYRHSEHQGLLDFNKDGLEKVIVSANTTRVDKNDASIFLPINMKDAPDYEIVFHTHPATPKPGGRVNIGILYEFPSLGDIYHFMDHYNFGATQSSLVITPEGLYNIRKLRNDSKKIKIDENKLKKEYLGTLRKAQENSIKKYGTKFSTNKFYSVIANDTTYIKELNNVLNKYGLHIDFFPRIKDRKGQWIIDTVYIPLRVIE